MRINLNPDGTGDLVIDGLLMIGETEVEVLEQRVAFRIIANGNRSHTDIGVPTLTSHPDETNDDLILDVRPGELGINRAGSYYKSFKAGHPLAVEFDRITNEYGFRVALKGGAYRYGDIPATTFLVMLESHPESWQRLYALMLEILRDSWGPAGTQLNANNLHGLSLFLSRSGRHPNFKISNMKTRLSRVPCSQLLDKVSKKRMETKGMNVAEASCDAFLDVYNTPVRDERNRIK